MRTIWKYRVHQLESFTHQIPKGARFLSVQIQNGTPEIWFTVETTQEMEERKFFMALTGQEIPQDLFNVADYLGTFQLSGGSIVCHLFEIQDPISALVRTTLTGQ